MLTPRQAEAHRFIFEFMRWRGQAPTQVEIGTGLGGIQKSSVNGILDNLEERGYIKRIPYMARAITLLKNPPLHNTAYFKAIYSFDEEVTELFEVAA